MWYSFDLTFLSCSLLSGGEERMANEVRSYIKFYSKPTTYLPSDTQIKEKGVYIFHNYSEIYYVGKTSRMFKQRFYERKGRATASNQRIWKIIDQKIGHYLLIPTSFSGQLEAILLNQGIKGEKQNRELVALRDYQYQKGMILETLFTIVNTPISFLKSIWSVIYK